MSDEIALTADEKALLLEALAGPILCAPEAGDFDRELARRRLQCCLSLCARQLLQRAAPRPGVRGWRPPPLGFLLTCEGWAVLKAERRHPGRGSPLRRTS